MLNYNQIESRPKNSDIVCECRNLILSKDFLQIYHRSFDRFFNLGENNIKTFPINNSLSFEKIDGSLIGFWFHPIRKNWFSCTRSLAFAEGTTPNGTLFQDLIVEALNGESVNDFCYKNSFQKDYSYILELVSPASRVVKPYEYTKLFLTAIRHKETGEYLSYDDKYQKLCSKVLLKPKIYKFSNIEDCMKFNKENKNPFDEGFVIYDPKTQQRVKIKSPSYLAISNMRINGAISTQKIVNLVFSQDYEEYLLNFKEDTPLFEPYIKAYDDLYQVVHDMMDLYGDIDNRKKFAKIIGDLPCASILYAMKDGKKWDEIIDKLGDSNKIRLLNNYITKK